MSIMVNLTSSGFLNQMDVSEVGIMLIAYVFLFLTSGKILFFILNRIDPKGKDIEVDKKARDTGYVVGKCENFLLVTLVLLDAYTALAIVFTAKTIVRKEDMQKNTLYFLAGTMINFSYSVLIGIILKTILLTFYGG